VRVRREPGRDAEAAAREALPGISAAEARGEEVALDGVPPCLFGRPIRGLRVVPGPGRRRIAWCAACEDARICDGFFADDAVDDLSRRVRPRLGPFDARVALRHFARLREVEALPAEPLRSIERALVDRVASRPDGPTTPLEFSIAWRAGRVVRYRFSCALPDGCAGRIEGDLAFARQLARLVPGLDEAALCERWPAPANVVHVLFGIEAADGTIARAKTYFALREGPHMIGIDAVPGGGFVEKVYLRGADPSDDVRVESPAGVAKAVDVPLLRRNLGAAAVEAPVVGEALRALGARIVPTRLSRSATDARDVTLYYWVR
jgi:hypothetical protein